jgi:hypothetical protein
MYSRSALAAILLLISNACLAQDFRGSLEGSVKDAAGAGIAAANVVVQLAGSSLERKTITDRNGEFRVDSLQPGDYTVSIAAQGLTAATSSVNVPVASSRQIQVTLLPIVKETVNVQSGASSVTTEPLQVSNTVEGAVITSRDLDSIPLANRSFANIAYLAPGTEPVEPSDPTKARITAVSFGGSSGLNDVLSVDGADNSDDYIGGFLQNFSPDDIQEFAVRTAQEDADIGRTVGGAVVITTKRGTNDWHGGGAF